MGKTTKSDSDMNNIDNFLDKFIEVEAILIPLALLSVSLWSQGFVLGTGTGTRTIHLEPHILYWWFVAFDVSLVSLILSIFARILPAKPNTKSYAAKWVTTLSSALIFGVSLVFIGYEILAVLRIVG